MSPPGHALGTPVYREKEDMYDEIMDLKKVASLPAPGAGAVSAFPAVTGQRGLCWVQPCESVR